MSFIENLGWRYAVKKFSGEKVSGEKIEHILNAIAMAPTSFGTQPFHVTVIENSEANKALLENLKKTANGNEDKFEICSHMLVFSRRIDVQKRFLGIEKLKGMENSFLAKAGFGFEHFITIFSVYGLGRLLTKNSWASNQTYLPLGFALAACAELKVDSCPMEGFNTRTFRKLLNLQAPLKPVVLLAVGYRATDDKVYPKARFPESDLFTKI